MRTLCISIHDVAPATWTLCRRLREAVREVDPQAPVTLLVVPNYHNDGLAAPAAYIGWLRACIAQGDEVALHGYTHRDEGAFDARGMHGLARRFYTAGEGEFAALSRQEAVRRIAQGRLWCAAQGLAVRGFVAPAWLLGRDAWAALGDFDFEYTTTLGGFHMLRSGASLRAPSIVYSARSRWRRSLSYVWNSALTRAGARLPLMRLGLHPIDAAHPAIMHHAQAMLRVLLRDRVALTKGAFAARHPGVLRATRVAA